MDFADLLTKSLASFFGAWAAFTFARWQRRRDDTRAELAAGRRIFYVLLAQRAQLVNWWKDQGVMNANQSQSWAELKPLLHGDVPPLDWTAVNTLAERCPPELAYDLSFGELNFTATVRTILKRNEAHLELQEKFAAQFPGHSGVIYASQAPAVAGPRLEKSLRDLTKSVFDGVQQLAQLNEKNIGALRAYLVPRFSEAQKMFEPIAKP